MFSRDLTTKTAESNSGCLLISNRGMVEELVHIAALIHAGKAVHLK